MSKNGIARRVFGALFSLIMTVALPHATIAATAACPNRLSNGIPKRTSKAPTGSELMQSLRQSRGRQRDEAVLRQVLSGNVPTFIRELVPVDVSGRLANGKLVLVTICVTPDYLAVGNDRDHVRVPMGLAAAARVANEFGFLLPTTKIVDEIYKQARVRLAPQPMKPSAQMESVDYLMRHNQTIDAQRKDARSRLADLIAGQKKDIVLTNRLRNKPGRVAIYGWHLPNGRPIQPLSTVHGAEYADYSHGVRLVSRAAFMNGRPVDLAQIMGSRDLASVVSNEGPITDARRLLASQF